MCMHVSICIYHEFWDNLNSAMFTVEINSLQWNKLSTTKLVLNTLSHIWPAAFWQDAVKFSAIQTGAKCKLYTYLRSIFANSFMLRLKTDQAVTH